jgi:hypothetical protein
MALKHTPTLYKFPILIGHIYRPPVRGRSQSNHNLRNITLSRKRESTLLQAITRSFRKFPHYSPPSFRRRRRHGVASGPVRQAHLDPRGGEHHLIIHVQAHSGQICGIR